MNPRSNKQLRSDLTRLTLRHMGFDGAAVTQGSDSWETMRLGVITASRAKDLIAKGRSANSIGEARNTYLMELIAEVATGQQKRSGGKASAWGHEHEESCVGLYGFDAGVEVETIPFVYGDDSMRYGASPDGLIGDALGIEAKNPFNTAVYLKFVLNGEIKPEYIEQVQFSMFVTGREQWVFANHDPDVRNYILHSITIDRDEAKMKTFADAIGQFSHDMDRALEKLGYKFGDQWTPLINTRKAA
ncbi:YqaJ viral recombinase family protein [Chromobacterium subtsugae]|uniref:YqaJ viral recombinase family protein n=1 Tax=Chromobacterium subtsugae TaxID=251747 RepID=A0ABS7FG59_9NEIS|nr:MULTISPECIES: YqaJ viral recombinase family protein [Chromobacterium]MBW7567822.1 YqaJ viral recombinase family protein [Chromobacterium subtsugae]MBW8289049.1 YqaJ viral recombinase family protein [Chromobacterium subtsugae]WSE93807.1 YqaJ viral recombinase family protein [Chromobacterium subtsugae]WVH62184.1 YqaJ viral recombinase family protein [Chromobacterium subtsugae]